MKNKIKIAIIVESGNVIAVNSNSKNVEYVIIDHDNFDMELPPVSNKFSPERINDNIYEMYDRYSPVQDAEIHDILKKIKF